MQAAVPKGKTSRLFAGSSGSRNAGVKQCNDGKQRFDQRIVDAAGGKRADDRRIKYLWRV